MFTKWDIIYISKFPESIKCSACNHHFTILNYSCTHCGNSENVTNIIAKVRPVLLWLDKSNWYQSMSFAIPLSTSNLIDDKYNETILLSDYIFTHIDSKFQRPMRAVIHQATRIDGNVLKTNKMIGKVTDQLKQSTIESKLIDWLFPT